MASTAGHQTGITGMPSLFDVVSAFSMFTSDVFQMFFRQDANSASFQRASVAQDNGAYNAATRKYEGSEGLTYRVPLHDLPSERMCKQRIANIKIIMDNVRRMSVNDELPSTAEEKKFWAAYRFVKYQVFIAPFSCILPPVYIFFKVFQGKIPIIWRGRSVPVTLSAMLAEQWAEQSYPAHYLMSTALNQKTPLGDAARAEWQRLHSVNIPFHIYAAYQVQNFFGNAPRELQFGGDAVALCNS
ncbi:Hypothetical protein, putative [Bodo saltans]|uniref:Uncharacterized protein n=1 Tax=Bodo saltans TaxID=75058 RepID=A0A0S4J1S1_BODSA|nr:Hypothetical protein, putative [Bodo saltans]|eukprot:CUG05075.1 Hypothetical protein, putative [Bodo saltans]